jgi:hypothetical protein
MTQQGMAPAELGGNSPETGNMAQVKAQTTRGAQDSEAAPMKSRAKWPSAKMKIEGARSRAKEKAGGEINLHTHGPPPKKSHKEDDEPFATVLHAIRDISERSRAEAESQFKTIIRVAGKCIQRINGAASQENEGSPTEPSSGSEAAPASASAERVKAAELVLCETGLQSWWESTETKEAWQEVGHGA